VSATTDPRRQGGIFFTSHASSDRGRARPGNEDAFYRGVTIFAVADGMGGHQAGEVASETAVAPLAEIDGREWTTAGEAEAALSDAVRSANTDVVRQAAANPEWRGMGTTLTAVLIREGRLHVAHVGDSRAYLFRPREGLSQLTTDHTLVEQLVRDGRISRDEVATHPQRSVITRAIGVESDVEVDSLAPLGLEPGDQVLLCSDGLSGPVDDSEIAQILSGTADGDAACDALVRAANRAGGPDNITVVLLRVTDREPEAGAEARRIAGLDDDTPDPRSSPRRISTAPKTTQDFDADRLRHYGADPAASADLSPHRPIRAILGWSFGVIVLLGVIGLGGYIVLSRSWFVGIDDGEVAIFRGLPDEVAGISLSRVAERSGVEVADLPERLVRPLRSGITEESLVAAQARVDNLADMAEGETPEQPSAAPSIPPPSRLPPAIETPTAG
jgi:PPM family protein phosphatase